ncbi:MAG: DUF3800 domain-containing protein [Candidatus Saccharimonadales bacterium]
MEYVYIDESGDLSRSTRSSRHIVIAAISTRDYRSLTKLARKIWVTKHLRKKDGELHAIHASASTRRKLLVLLNEMEISIKAVIVDKVCVSENLLETYYRTLVRVIDAFPHAQTVMVDKRDTLKKRLTILQKLHITEAFRNVQFADSRAVKPLQIVDFVCWSIFQKLEYANNEYFDLIAQRTEIIHEK